MCSPTIPVPGMPTPIPFLSMFPLTSAEISSSSSGRCPGPHLSASISAALAVASATAMGSVHPSAGFTSLRSSSMISCSLSVIRISFERRQPRPDFPEHLRRKIQDIVPLCFSDLRRRSPSPKGSRCLRRGASRLHRVLRRRCRCPCSAGMCASRPRQVRCRPGIQCSRSRRTACCGSFRRSSSCCPPSQSGILRCGFRAPSSACSRAPGRRT